MAPSATPDRLLADLGTTFRPQRQWVEGRGVWLIVGHFLSSVGAGTWVFSLWLGYRPGLGLALAAVALSGLAHLRFLGRGARFWKMYRVRTSWIARGFVGMSLFLPGAALHLLREGVAVPRSVGEHDEHEEIDRTQGQVAIGIGRGHGHLRRLECTQTAYTQSAYNIAEAGWRCQAGAWDSGLGDVGRALGSWLWALAGSRCRAELAFGRACRAG